MVEVKIDEAAVIRPGDTLVVRVTAQLSKELADEMVDALTTWMPDVQVAVIVAEGLAVYRPDPRLCTCGWARCERPGEPPQKIRSAADPDCPQHGGQQ